jgi:SsrA-binding protein
MITRSFLTKSLRDNKVQIKESYVILKNNELFLFGSHISPLKYASTHVNADPTRTRKLLLHRLEINPYCVNVF